MATIQTPTPNQESIPIPSRNRVIVTNVAGMAGAENCLILGTFNSVSVNCNILNDGPDAFETGLSYGLDGPSPAKIGCANGNYIPLSGCLLPLG
jgi:hypothetical protein